KLSVQEWIEIWDRIYLQYGSCFIDISGGEPTLYPDFFVLLKALTKKHKCIISTNFSWDPKIIIPEISKENLQIFATFHPKFIDFNEFYNKVKYSKDYIQDSLVAYVGHKEQIQNIPFYKKEFQKININLLVHPLRDEGFDIEDNTIKNTHTSKGQKIINDEEDKNIIIENTTELNEYRLGVKSPKGKMCRSGMDSICIWPDGIINRCTRYRDEILGNIQDINFKFSDLPNVCNKDLCPIEYRMIIE
ncbi:MAG: hypothetical protein PHH62_07050, partial [Endomicrobiaceae bacterium]|nr:hypothetical protein [Endomicrobiaceae bacterium]